MVIPPSLYVALEPRAALNAGQRRPSKSARTSSSFYTLSPLRCRYLLSASPGTSTGSVWRCLTRCNTSSSSVRRHTGSRIWAGGVGATNCALPATWSSGSTSTRYIYDPGRSRQSKSRTAMRTTLPSSLKISPQRRSSAPEAEDDDYYKFTGACRYSSAEFLRMNYIT